MSWKDRNYEIVITADGSPSLFWKASSEAIGELMHHRAGALGETRLIYGTVAHDVLAQGGRKFLSLGLGLGYGEMAIAEKAVQLGISDLEILSLEADPFLTQNLRTFLENPNSTGETTQIYSSIFEKIENPKAVLELLQRLIAEGRWQFDGALGPLNLPKERYHGILYDAFSSKTSPELWTEDFLNNFLEQCSGTQLCFFSTYACTGPLKRALARQGFEVIVREGFHGKRNSTLGRRVGSSS